MSHDVDSFIRLDRVRDPFANHVREPFDRFHAKLERRSVGHERTHHQLETGEDIVA